MYTRTITLHIWIYLVAIASLPIVCRGGLLDDLRFWTCNGDLAHPQWVWFRDWRNTSYLRQAPIPSAGLSSTGQWSHMGSVTLESNIAIKCGSLRQTSTVEGSTCAGYSSSETFSYDKLFSYATTNRGLTLSGRPVVCGSGSGGSGGSSRVYYDGGHPVVVGSGGKGDGRNDYDPDADPEGPEWFNDPSSQLPPGMSSLDTTATNTYDGKSKQYAEGNGDVSIFNYAGRFAHLVKAVSCYGPVATALTLTTDSMTLATYDDHVDCHEDGTCDVCKPHGQGTPSLVPFMIVGLEWRREYIPDKGRDGIRIFWILASPFGTRWGAGGYYLLNINNNCLITQYAQRPSRPAQCK